MGVGNSSYSIQIMKGALTMRILLPCQLGEKANCNGELKIQRRELVQLVPDSRNGLYIPLSREGK